VSKGESEVRAMVDRLASEATCFGSSAMTTPISEGSMDLLPRTALLPHLKAASPLMFMESAMSEAATEPDRSRNMQRCCGESRFWPVPPQRKSLAVRERLVNHGALR
jgi:hypothetical protein